MISARTYPKTVVSDDSRDQVCKTPPGVAGGLSLLWFLRCCSSSVVSTHHLFCAQHQETAAWGEGPFDLIPIDLIPPDQSPRAHLHVVGMLWFMSDINQPSWPTPFYSVLVSISAFMALSTVFHSINSPDNSPFSDSVLPVLSLPDWSLQQYIPL